jgi:hypothetical protein
MIISYYYVGIHNVEYHKSMRQIRLFDVSGTLRLLTYNLIR